MAVCLLRRFLLVFALAFWQGGFMFYGGVVVPVGARILESHEMQGFVTRAVTDYLNIAGAVALAIWCWDLAAERKVGHRYESFLRWLVWLSLVALLGCQLLFHRQLDDLLETEGFTVLDRKAYRQWHWRYLFASTLQWLGAIVLCGLMLWTWKRSDGRAKLNKVHGTST